MSGVVVRLRHRVLVRYCRDGMEAFCARNGIDFDRLRKDGIPEEELAHIDDVHVTRLIEKIREKNNGR